MYASSGEIIVNLMKFYNWNRIAIVTSTDFLWTSIMAGVRSDVEKNNLFVSFFQNFNDETVTDSYLKDLFKAASSQAHGKFSLLINISFDLD